MKVFEYEKMHTTKDRTMIISDYEGGTVVFDTSTWLYWNHEPPTAKHTKSGSVNRIGTPLFLHSNRSEDYTVVAEYLQTLRYIKETHTKALWIHRWLALCTALV